MSGDFSNFVQWAEGETGGEAFIPMPPGQRRKFSDEWCRERRDMLISKHALRLPIRRCDALKAFFRGHL